MEAGGGRPAAAKSSPAGRSELPQKPSGCRLPVAGCHKTPYSLPMRIAREFLFEAAHFLPSAPPGHPNSRLHGHSFRVRVWVEGEPSPATGLVFHFDDLSAALEDSRDALDHRMLNDIDGLTAPTLERIAIWLWGRLEDRVPGLLEIEIHRDSCREGCIYRGPQSSGPVAAE
jgi:6-pyruvoyltetrahydropterin/6-carboxytetrahydropterin synthase